MSTEDTSSLVTWYRERIGEPATDDEARGYWIFVGGVVAGVLGILFGIVGAPASGVRELAIVLGSIGLVLLLAGPIIRLPLRRTATLLTYAGVAIAALGIVWFIVAFPQNWGARTGNSTIVAVYGIGVAIIGIGGVIVPLLTSPSGKSAVMAREEAEAHAGTLQSEIANLQDDLEEAEADEEELASLLADVRKALAGSEAERDSLAEALDRSHAEQGVLASEIANLQDDLEEVEADEEDLAECVSELREALTDAEADEADLAAAVSRLRAELTSSETEREALMAALADTEADEADLAAELRALRTSQGRFELYQDKAEEWRWRLRHRNGNVVASSGEGYTRRHNAQKGMQSVRRNALGATVFEIPKEADLPDAEDEFEPVTETESQASFELYEDNAGEYRWRLVHDNGNILADSAEGYSRKGNARRALEGMKQNAAPADYLWFDPAGFETYRDNAGEYRWRLVSRNGNILADGGEGYATHGNARRAVRRLRESIDDLEFEVYEDNAGEHRWRARAGNDELVADSSEGYASRSGADDAVERVQQLAPEADTLEVGMAAFEIYQDNAEEWRWRLRHRNGNILADSGEGYSDRSGARDGIESVKRNASGAEIAD